MKNTNTESNKIWWAILQRDGHSFSLCFQFMHFVQSQHKYNIQKRYILSTLQTGACYTLKGSDDGVWHSGLMGFWTLSIIRYSKKQKNTTFWKLDLFPFSGEKAGDTTLGRSSKLNTLCVVRSWEPDPKEIRNRRHIASIAFPVNVADATLA
jgi:hypothetical protein